MSSTAQIFRGQCHCGSVRFDVALANGLNGAIRCNCSICRARGAVMVFADLADLKLNSGEEHLATYQFNSNTAKHHFCRRCGIYTHHQRRFDPNQYGINVACLEGVSPFDFKDVSVADGAHHPADHGGGALRIVGRLHYEELET